MPLPNQPVCVCVCVRVRVSVRVGASARLLTVKHDEFWVSEGLQVVLELHTGVVRCVARWSGCRCGKGDRRHSEPGVQVQGGMVTEGDRGAHVFTYACFTCLTCASHASQASQASQASHASWTHHTPSSFWRSRRRGST